MRIVMVDAVVPCRVASAGERAVCDLIDSLRVHGHEVALVALAATGDDRDRIAALPAEVVATGDNGIKHLRRVIRDQRWDVVIAHRPGPAVMALPALESARSASIFYGHDIHQWRLANQQRLLGDVPRHRVMVTKAGEDRCWQTYDLTVYPTDREAAYVNETVAGRGVAQPYYRLTADDLRGDSPATVRRGVLMVGPSAHAPNRDAVRFAVEELLPLIDESLTVVGDWPAADRSGLEGPRVRFTGMVTEAALRDLHAEHIALVAPLRFGGGSRRKLVAAMGLGLPVVTTSEGARGLFVTDATGEDPVFVVDDPARMAFRIHQLRENPGYAESVARLAHQRVAQVYGQRTYDQRVTDMLAAAIDRCASRARC